MKNKRLMPVLHLRDREQALRNAKIVVDAGVHHIFLIHHKARYPKLISLANEVHKEFPELWIGINALDKEPEEILSIVPEWVNAVWSDNGGVIEVDGFIVARRAYNISVIRREKRRLNFEFFGGYAFKYQAPITKLEEGATCASLYCDVVTTSGDGTGQAADLEKIRRIRKGTLGRLAIASGITPDNFTDYEDYVDDYLVSTGISIDEYNFNPLKLQTLQSLISLSNLKGCGAVSL